MGKIKPWDRAEIVKLRANGVKVSKIADMYDTTTSYIYYICKEESGEPFATEEKEREIIAFFKSHSNRETKEKFGLSDRKLNMIARRAGALKNNQGYDREEIRKAWVEGLSCAEIAKQMQVSETTVYTNIGGLEPHQRVTTVRDVQEIRRMHAEGKSIGEISRVLGIHYGAVKKFIREEGEKP